MPDRKEEQRYGECKHAVGVTLFYLHVDHIGEEGRDRKGHEKQKDDCPLPVAREGKTAHHEDDGELERKQEKEGLEKIDAKKVIAEELYSRCDDEGRERHSSGVKADGVARRSHVGGAGGESFSVQEAFRRRAYEVPKLVKRAVYGVVEAPRRREAEGQGEDNEQRQECAMGTV